MMKWLLIILLVLPAASFSQVTWYAEDYVYNGGLPDLAQTTNKTSSSSVTVSTSINPTSDRGTLLHYGYYKWVMVYIAKDNTSSASDGDNGEVTSVTDNAGNTYTKTIELTNVQGGAAAGATVSVWYANISSSTTITSVTANLAASTAAKSMIVLWGYLSSSTGLLAHESIIATTVGDNATVAALQNTGMPAAEHFNVAAVAMETASTYSAATGGAGGSNFTFQSYGTSGGGSASNMRLGMGIGNVPPSQTASGSCTFTPSVNSDHAAVMVSWKETTAPSASSTKIYRIQ